MTHKTKMVNERGGYRKVLTPQTLEPGMSDTYKGATRDEFVARLKGFSRKEIVTLMRAEGAEAPVASTKTSHEAFCGLCFDVLVGKAPPAPASSSSAPEQPNTVRYEIRSTLTSRCRCGHRFTPHAQQFASNAFTPAELETLRADPYLQVVDLARGGR